MYWSARLPICVPPKIDRRWSIEGEKGKKKKKKKKKKKRKRRKKRRRRNNTSCRPRPWVAREPSPPSLAIFLSRGERSRRHRP
ncbi:hypothetical protein BHM03_00048493, partial [Ensete ventricosum]